MTFRKENMKYQVKTIRRPANGGHSFKLIEYYAVVDMETRDIVADRDWNTNISKNAKDNKLKAEMLAFGLNIDDKHSYYITYEGGKVNFVMETDCPPPALETVYTADSLEELFEAMKNDPTQLNQAVYWDKININ